MKSITGLIFLVIFILGLASAKASVSDEYMDLIVTYSIHARSLWHEADVGGYWGPVGIAEPDQNGAVRGMTDTMMDYAMIVHEMDEHRLNEDLQKRLAAVGLDRQTLLKYVRANLAHICAHHKSAAKPLEPVWGLSWQSTFWLGNAGPAVLLVYGDLSDELKDGFKRVVFLEAERVVGKPPKTYLPGDTGAEENGWDEYAPAMALALDPANPRAAAWLKALKSYAVNTYSMAADRKSDAMIGQDRERDIVVTTNLFDDFTLENHGFFHPDYMQVSGQELGDSLLFLELGDWIHRTHLAEEFRPYAMHHVKEVWEKVLRPLLLPIGEFAFPNGSDWQLNTSMMPAYFGFIATQIHDPIAGVGVERHLMQEMHHRELSPPGKILGDTNMEWFWEPIMSRRSATVVLDYEMHPPAAVTPEDRTALETTPMQRYFPDTSVWLYRNANYLATAAWGPRHMGTFYPFVTPPANPYLTTPIDGILPNEVVGFDSQHVGSPDEPQSVAMKLADGRKCYLVCLPHSVLWLSPVSLRSMGIENDRFSGGERILYSDGDTRTVKALKAGEKFNLGQWVNVDDVMGLITTESGFHYKATEGFNRRSLAYDQISPAGPWGAWQMIPNITHDQTQAMSREFIAALDHDDATIALRDGPSGKAYKVNANLSTAVITISTRRYAAMRNSA